MEASQFKSNQYVKFCPGCGDHAICMALQKAMAEVGVPTHQTVVISGIGCSSRMPHYLNTYGFKPGILPLEGKVPDKQKETLQCPCRGGSGWRHHHKLPLTEYVQR